MTKLFIKQPLNKEYSPRPTCPFCDYCIVWKHARYIRKGTHSKSTNRSTVERTVQRWLCKKPVCRRTFCVLPENTLPYCRFGLNDFISIYSQAKVLNAYAIWRSCELIGVSLRAIVRLLSLFSRVVPLLQKLFREIKGEVNEDLAFMSHFLVSKFTWFGFTTRWYHAMYPARLWEIQNPHNL